MRSPAGREFVFQALVSLFVAVVCFVAVVIFLRWEDTTAGLVSVAVFLLFLFLFGIRVSARSPGDKRSDR
jgi:hypothetical protein